MSSPAVKNDLSLYDRCAADWWDPRSHAFRSLHRVTQFRAVLIREWFGATLRGSTVVDLGCGGGLLAEPLARGGARVIGVDTSHASLRAAVEHGRISAAGRCHYVRGDLSRSPLRSGCADLVLLADVLEHVRDVRGPLAEAARLLASGGHLYVNTLNRTWRSRLLAITVAEGLGLVPRGTHDPALFVDPGELQRAALGAGLHLERLQGESPRVLETARRWAIALEKSRDTSVAYSAAFVKDGAP